MSFKAAIEKIRPSIFQVQLTMPAPVGLGGGPLGTAFAVSSDGHLMTALHVIEAGEGAIGSSPGSGSMMAAFAGKSVEQDDMKILAAFAGHAFEVVARDSRNDLALLKLGVKLADIRIRTGSDPANEVSPKCAKIHSPRPDDGEPIGVSGYPLGEPSLVSNAGHIANRWTLVSKGAPASSYECYLGDLTSNPGNSGGPVYRTSDGKVLGLLTGSKLTHTLDSTGKPLASTLQTAGLSVIVPGGTINDLLVENGVTNR